MDGCFCSNSSIAFRVQVKELSTSFCHSFRSIFRHYPLSHVGQIVTNPTAYLANHPRLQRTESPPLPDVTVVGSKIDDHTPPYRAGAPSQKCHAIPGGYEGTAGLRSARRPPSYPVKMIRVLTLSLSVSGIIAVVVAVVRFLVDVISFRPNLPSFCWLFFLVWTRSFLKAD